MVDWRLLWRMLWWRLFFLLLAVGVVAVMVVNINIWWLEISCVGVLFVLFIGFVKTEAHEDREFALADEKK